MYKLSKVFYKIAVFVFSHPKKKISTVHEVIQNESEQVEISKYNDDLKFEKPEIRIHIPDHVATEQHFANKAAFDEAQKPHNKTKLTFPNYINLN